MRSRIRSSYNGFFIPSGALLEILSTSQITSLVLEDEDLRLAALSDSTFVERIHKEGHKLLAACILAAVDPFGKFLLEFFDHDWLDSSMPFNPGDRPWWCSHFLEYEMLCNTQWTVTPLDLRPYNSKKGHRFRSEPTRRRRVWGYLQSPHSYRISGTSYA